jgi:hypothetical protein
MFRNLVLIGVAVGAASMAGWFSINREGDQTSIQFNRSEIRDDAQRAIDRGRKYFDERDQRSANQRGGESDPWNSGYDQQYDSQPTYADRDYQNPAPQNPAPQNPTPQYRADQYGAEPYRAEPYHADQYPSGQNNRTYQDQGPFREAGYRQPGSQVYRGQ